VKRLFFLGCVAGLVGCAEGRPAEIDDSLTQPVIVQTGAVEESNVTFTIEGGFAQPSAVTMAVAEPLIKLHTGGARAELDAVRLPLGDIMVSAEALPPKGVKLRNLVLTAGPAHAEIVHAQADALELHAQLPLALDWSVQLDDGSLYPLGTVRTEAFNVDVQVVRAAGKTTATLQAACDGTCWSVDGVAKLSNGALYLEAAADVTAAR
jgi:hypothetical protein